jgi:hypothetical protein
VEGHAARPLSGDYSGVLALPKAEVAAQLAGAQARIRGDGLREALLQASGGAPGKGGGGAGGTGGQGVIGGMGAGKGLAA